MNYFYTMLIFFLSTNFWISGSNVSDEKTSQNFQRTNKPPRPPLPAEHIPNFSNNNTSALSVFSPSLNTSSEGKKKLIFQEQQKTFQKKRVVIFRAPLPICYEKESIDPSKSCLKQQTSQIPQEQQESRQRIFHKKTNNSSSAPIPICHQDLCIISVNQALKSCLKQPQISQEQQELRRKIFGGRKKTTKIAFLIDDKKLEACSKSNSKKNNLRSAFLTNN